MKTIRLLILLLLIMIGCDLTPLKPPSPKFINDYPKDRENGWSDELQGVAHDDDYWYFTQKNRLWKFPVEYDLNEYVPLNNQVAGVISVPIPSELVKDGYNHFGDLDYYQKLLLVPVDGSSQYPPIIAVFNSSDLSYRGHYQLTSQKSAGWCAVYEADGKLYSSNSEIEESHGILSYSIDWNFSLTGDLPRSPRQAKLEDDIKAFQLIPANEIFLVDENGKPLKMSSMQGGEFYSFYLFTVNGYCESSATNTGIMIFTTSGQRVNYSTNGSGDFNFEYHPGDVWCREEPEGITVWDLDTNDAPGIKGQLHVIMIDNYCGVFCSNDDDLYFKHYRFVQDIDPKGQVRKCVDCGDKKCCDPCPGGGCENCVSDTESQQCP